ncbi:MAG: preprotein translocase subunit SecE [Bacilli bacterium]|nr:preprotein translocase subunit SecE [Bacilli bacterium]MBN2877004.1 preprotein translocase subunit SecE [Bacilli bacterium]
MAKDPNKKVKTPSQPKQKLIQDESRVMAILKKEYAFENWLLAVLAPVLILYGVYIVMGTFGSVNLANILGTSNIGFIDFFFSTDLRRILTGSFLILIGVLVLVYLFIPYLKPSFSELKKVTWPTGKTLASNSARVFTFLIFLSVVFVLLGLAFDPLFQWLISL